MKTNIPPAAVRVSRVGTVPRDLGDPAPSRTVPPARDRFVREPASVGAATAAGAPGVERADEYESAFRRTEGWTGADGTYSIPLRDGRLLWLFSDTLLGEVDARGRRTLRPDVPANPFGEHFINNTAALQMGKTPTDLRFLWAGDAGGEPPRSLMVPPDGRGWFWVNAGQQEADGSVTVILNRFEKSDEPRFLFGRQSGLFAARLRVGEDGIAVERCTPLGSAQMPEGRETVWGAALLDDGPWTYVYGCDTDEEGSKRMLVARAPRGQVGDDGAWTFWDGKGWSSEVQSAAPVASGASNECSVQRLRDGRYLWVGIDRIGPVTLRYADSPTGPWSKPTTAWNPPEVGGKVFAYNAKAHPHLSDERGLLISYNVNSFDAKQSLEEADVYRPRFVRVPWALVEQG